MIFVQMEDLTQRRRQFVTNLHTNIRETVQLRKAHDISLKSAVGIIIFQRKVLLGLADCEDERNGKWCFPGGGIEDKEDVMSAAVRESYEEVGVSTVPISQVVVIHPAKPMVGFVFLTCSEVADKIEYNEEFTDCKWFPVDSLPKEMLSINRDILKLAVK